MRKKITITAMSLLTALFLLPINTFAYTISGKYNLVPNRGGSRLVIPNKTILHEAGIDAPARSVAANMKNNYNGSNSYTTDVIGDGGIVYHVGEQGYVSRGAGDANPHASVQIELQRTYDETLFGKSYRAYIEYTKDSAKKYRVPLTPDQGASLFTKGIISHLWVANYVQGNHTGPYGYLSQMRASKEKLAYDLAHEFTDENPTTSENKPVIDPTRASAANSTLTDGTNHTHIDQLGEIESTNLHVTGWHIASYKYEYTFIMDYNTKKELVRVRADGVYRPGVDQTYNTSGNIDYHVPFNVHNLPNEKVYVMMRATNGPGGNIKGGAQDFHDKR